MKAGDHTALNLTLHHGTRYPLKSLAAIGGAAGVIGLGVTALLRNRPAAPSDRRDPEARSMAAIGG